MHRERKSRPEWDPDADDSLAMGAVRRADLAAVDFTKVDFAADSH